ncbi:MAG: hypothetical protein ACJA1H_001494 [Glaciecola sp.]|jgi:hypothetical protein
MKNLIPLKRITSLLVFSILLITIYPLKYIYFTQTSVDPYGLGLLIMLTIAIIGILWVAVDYILFKLIKNKWILNVVEIILIIGLVYFTWLI